MINVDACMVMGASQKYVYRQVKLVLDKVQVPDVIKLIINDNGLIDIVKSFKRNCIRFIKNIFEFYSRGVNLINNVLPLKINTLFGKMRMIFGLKGGELDM